MRAIIAAFLVLSAGLLSGWAPPLAGNGTVDTAHQCLRSNLPVTNYQCLTYPDPTCKTYTKPTDPNPTTLSTPEYQVAGHTWYVAPTGSDSTGDGSIGNPWATPHQVGSKIAAAAIADGDTVLFRGGTYNLVNGGVFSTNHPAAKWITLAAYPGETPIFNLANASNATLFTVQSSGGAGKMYRFSGLTLRATASQTTNRPLINIQGTPTSDIIWDHNDIANADDSARTSWTWQNWQTNTPGNIVAAIANTAASCVWYTANHIHNTTTIAFAGIYEGVAANELDHMTGDIVDTKCSHCKDINNFKHDPVLAVDPAAAPGTWVHGDYTQIQTPGGPYTDIQISGNIMIDWYAGDNNFPTADQPIIVSSAGTTYLTVTDNYMSGSAFNSINVGTASDVLIANNTCVWNGASMISFGAATMRLYTPPVSGTDDFFIVVNNLCNTNVTAQQVKALAHGVYQNNDFLNSYVDSSNTVHSTAGTYEGNKVLAAANSAILSNWSNAGTRLQLYYVAPNAPGLNWTVGDTMNVNLAGENATAQVTSVNNGLLATGSITTAGTGYAANNLFYFASAGNGAGVFKATTVDGSGAITGISVNTAGLNYSAGNALTLPSGGTITVTSVDGSGKITGVSANGAGSNWVVNDTLNFAGSVAFKVTTATGGALTAVSITGGGSGHSINETFTGPSSAGTITVATTFDGEVTAAQVISSGTIPVASLPLNQYYSIPGAGTSVTSCAIGGGCTGFSAALYYGFTLGTTFPQDPTLASAVTPIGDGVTQASLNTLTAGWGFQPTLPSYNINGALFASPPASPPNVGAY